MSVMRVSSLKSLVMYLLSALFLATSGLPVHAHLAAMHEHDDQSHQHQRSIHSHDAIDHAGWDATAQHEQAHELSVVELSHDLAGLTSLAAVTCLAVGKPPGFPISAVAKTGAPPAVAVSPPTRPVAHDSEPRAPPA